MIDKIERFLKWYESLLDRVAVGVGSTFLVLAFLVVMIGQLRSCVGSRKEPSEPPPQVRALDLSRDSDRKLHDALVEVLSEGSEKFKVAIVVSNDINAASMGNGHYLLWDGLSALPDWAIVAIIAHEYGHDRLMHSQKEHDRTDFTLYWTELIGSVGGADIQASGVINDWGTNLVIPKFSKEEELEADRDAIKTLNYLGCEHPGEVYAKTLELLLERYGDTGGKYSDRHPATSERIKLARSLDFEYDQCQPKRNQQLNHSN